MITLTDTAASKVRDLLDSEGAEELALRVAVRPGGAADSRMKCFLTVTLHQTMSRQCLVKTSVR